jgi:hypothetical protein
MNDSEMTVAYHPTPWNKGKLIGQKPRSSSERSGPCAPDWRWPGRPKNSPCCDRQQASRMRSGAVAGAASPPESAKTKVPARSSE